MLNQTTSQLHSAVMAFLRHAGGQSKLVALAEQAGAAILRVRESTDFTVLEKADKSPVTEADLAANAIIVAKLPDLCGLPIISEESRRDDGPPPEAFWLVDPLDGTKEFIAGRGDFTVNIALVEKGCPVFGVVHAPTRQLTYWGGPGLGAWRKQDDAIAPIHVATQPEKPLRVVASASHLNEETKSYLKSLGEHRLVQAGSSIKICMIAEGSADLYPRLGPTCEWDTAAADAVLRGAGGMLYRIDGAPVRYGKADILNPHFLARPMST